MGSVNTFVISLHKKGHINCILYHISPYMVNHRSVLYIYHNGIICQCLSPYWRWHQLYVFVLIESIFIRSWPHKTLQTRYKCDLFWNFIIRKRNVVNLILITLFRNENQIPWRGIRWSEFVVRLKRELCQKPSWTWPWSNY